MRPLIALALTVWAGWIGVAWTHAPRAVAPSPLRLGSIAPTDPAEALLSGWGLPINRADAAQLAALPGIGPQLAERIVVRRTAVGQFTTPHDLDRVPGIGPALLRRLLPCVSFE